MAKNNDIDRFTGPLPTGVVRDSNGTVIYPVDKDERKRALEVERAWELCGEGDDSEVRRLGIIGE